MLKNMKWTVALKSEIFTNDYDKSEHELGCIVALWLACSAHTKEFGETYFFFHTVCVEFAGSSQWDFLQVLRVPPNQIYVL